MILAEFDGEAKFSGRKNLTVTKSDSHEYYMTGSMDVDLNEEEKKIRFLAETCGIVKIISYRSASNKTVDRRRVLIKDEREYVIPEGAQLKFDNVMLNSGDEVEEGQKLTGPIPFVSEIDGTVSIRDHYERQSILLEENMKPEDLVGAMVVEDISAELMGPEGEPGEDVALPDPAEAGLVLTSTVDSYEWAEPAAAAR